MSKRKLKVFILGVSGFVGYNLALRLQKDFLISGACFSNLVHLPGAQIFPVDMKKADILETLLGVYTPDILINAVGMVDRKAIEASPKMADSINLMMPVSMAILANKMRAKFLQLSCAIVYDGSDGNYTEDNLDFSMHDSLGKQKLAAESYIRAQTLESTILRLGAVMGLGGPTRPSAFDRVRFDLNAKKNVDASKKLIQSYLSVDSLARAVTEVIRGEFPGRHRIFNLGGVNTSEFDIYHGWEKLVFGTEKLVKPAADDSPRNYSLNCASFATTYPQWKPETLNELYSSILTELTPGVGAKKWQKTLQTP